MQTAKRGGTATSTGIQAAGPALEVELDPGRGERLRLAREIRAELAMLGGLLIDALGRNIRLGELLLEAKAACGRGHWHEFLGEIGLSARTASEAMKLAREKDWLLEQLRIQGVEGNLSVARALLSGRAWARALPSPTGGAAGAEPGEIGSLPPDDDDGVPPPPDDDDEDDGVPPPPDDEDDDDDGVPPPPDDDDDDDDEDDGVPPPPDDEDDGVPPPPDDDDDEDDGVPPPPDDDGEGLPGWLAGLPIRTRLSGDRLAGFDREALAWHRDKPARDGLAATDAARDPATPAGRATPLGPYRARVRLLLSVGHPSTWRPCAPCRGSGRLGAGRGACAACDEAGFRLDASGS